MADAEEKINLRALKKIDDNIDSIIFSAGQVAIYYFNVDSNQWARKDIEGPLFFVRRMVVPEYAFVVINRLSTINLVQKITKDLETNLQSPYLMYKNNENEIYCVWFYDKEKSALVNEKIAEIVEHSVPPTLTELVKPIAQRRSVNLNNLFNCQLMKPEITPTKLNFSTSTNGDRVLDNADHLVMTPQRSGMKDEVSKKLASPVTPLMMSSSMNSNPMPMMPMPLGSDGDRFKPPVDAFFQHPTLLPTAPPCLFENNAPEKADSEKPLKLTHQQLKETLIHLLQHDADFLHTIHTAYLATKK